jgi:glycosyltransferase involved in cell wall biosynthesis
MPGVSVLMPCYNASNTLEEALQSLIEQTYQDFEIVAVDDGSIDSTPSILSRWSQEGNFGSRLRVLTQAHCGIIPALNSGLSACRGNFIARMDTDDRCHPQRLEKQIQFLDSHPDIAVLGCLVRLFPEGSVREGFRIYVDWLNTLVTNEQICREIFVESPLAHPSVMVQREWLDQVGGYQEHGWPEDYDLWLRMYLQGASFAKVPQVLLDWRESPERLTRQDSRYSLENFLRAKAHYLSFGPLQDRDAVVIWGAGMVGRRLGKQLARLGIPLAAFIDIDPRKIGHTRRGRPILSPDSLVDEWRRYQNPVILAAVGARGARVQIRQRLETMGFVEGRDWWSVA